VGSGAINGRTAVIARLRLAVTGFVRYGGRKGGQRMAKYTLTVNGKARAVDSDPARPLLDVLREDLALTGTKYGCGEGQCRACTVLLDGAPVTSCATPVRAAAGKAVTTIEGLAASQAKLHPVQQAFIENSAMQCGYCTPGMVLRTAALLKTTPKPTDAQIVESLNGSLCRCCGYSNVVAAVKAAAAMMPAGQRGVRTDGR
jgi:aerobic-type carbon monoxide dehydrogenase small subunit (CoxS/CutS family)